MKPRMPRMTTFRRAQRGRAVVCDVCGALVEASERGRGAHCDWHQGTDTVIDVRDRHTERTRQTG